MVRELGDTIVAISTPLGVGGIGIVRLSGPAALDIFSTLWAGGSPPVDRFVPRRVYVGYLKKSQEGKEVVLDQVTVVWFRSPYSYTGEDVVEIGCHGGVLVVRRILNALLEAGARLAQPGEFTKRAFLNGRIDLVQAEAVADLINARADAALKNAQAQLSGVFSRRIKGVLERVKGLCALVEAAIDFPDEDVEEVELERAVATLEGAVGEIRRLVNTYSEGRLIKEGVRTVIVGSPNVGKSSLLNAMLGVDRALVHHIPGTTRDHIEEELEIGGVCFRLTDTAGLRIASDEVEVMGVDLAYRKLAEADIVLYVVDGSAPLHSEELKQFCGIKGKVPCVLVFNKCDLGRVAEVPGDVRLYCWTSAKTGTGIVELKDMLVETLTELPFWGDVPEGELVTNERHKRQLLAAVEALERAITDFSRSAPLDLIAVYLREAITCLGVIVGEVTTDDILDEIFKRFCIGK